MAEKLMHDSQAAADLRMLMESAADAKAPAEAESTSAERRTNEAKQKEERKKNEPGKLQKLGDAAVRTAADTASSVVGGFQQGGKRIADAILPPDPRDDGNVKDRLMGGTLGAIESLFAAAMGVSGASAGGGAAKSIVDQIAGEDSKAPLPESLRNAYATANFLFNLPQFALDPKNAANNHELARKSAAEQFQKDQNPTYGDLSNLVGMVLGGKLGHKATAGKGAVEAPKVDANEAKFKAATEAKTPPPPPDPGRFEPTEEWAKKHNARVAYDNQRLMERQAQARAKVAADKEAAANSNGGAPAPGESAADAMGGIPTKESRAAADAAALEQLRRNEALLGKETPEIKAGGEQALTGAKDVVEQAGGKFLGEDENGVWFNDPQTDSTHLIPKSQPLTADAVVSSMEKSRADYAAEAQPEAGEQPSYQGAFDENGNQVVAPDMQPEPATIDGRHPYVNATEPLQPHDIAMANEYDAATTDPAAKPAWDKLAEETNREYERIAQNLKVEKVTGQPYATAEEMNKDIANGRFKVTTDNSEHPFWDEDQNWRFRVVHDFLGHFEGKNDFSLQGETKAYHDHARSVQDPLARQALQTEVYGQAASAIANGQFSEQKAFLSQQPEPPKPTVRLEHYSRQQGLTKIDPEKFGTGMAGRERRRAGESGFLNRSYHYAAGTEPEARFRGLNKYTTEVPYDSLLDLASERGQALRREAGNDPTAFEGLVRQRGYKGYGDSAGDLPNAYAIFEPLDVIPEQAPAAEAPKAGLQEPVPVAADSAPQEGTEAAAGAVPGTEQAQPAQEPLADPTEGTEGAQAAPALAPEGAAPVMPDPELEGTEAAGAPAPPAAPRTIADVQTMVAPAAQAAADAVRQEVQEKVLTEAQERQVREEATANAQAMRAAGYSRQQINEVYRAKLNEAGIKSKNQKAMEKKVDAATEQQLGAGNTESAPKGDPLVEQLQKSIAEVKRKLKALGADETGAIRMRGAVTENLRKNSDVWNDLKSVGAGVLHLGAREFAAWSKGMVEAVGPEVEPHLKELYPLAQAQLVKFNDTKFERDLPSLVQLKEARKAGEPGFEWYDKAPAELKARFGVNADLFAGAYAATSPLQDAATTNIDLAMQAYNKIITGKRNGTTRPFTPRKDGIMPVVADNLNRVAQGLRVSGPKINPFEGQLRQDAFTSGARNIPVIDTWMGRLFGFMSEGTPEKQQIASGTVFRAKGELKEPHRRFIETILTKMAADEGVDVAQVQAALWTDVKASVERQRVMEMALDERGNFKPGWDADRISDKLGKINEAMGTPFDQLLRNRLGPAVEAIRSGDMTANGDAVVARKTSAAILRQPSYPEGRAKVALQAMGMDSEYASRAAATAVDALRQAGMDDGAGGIELGHQEGVPLPPYDRVAAETAVAERLKGLCP